MLIIMNFQERFKGRIEMYSGKQDPSLQRPVDKAVKAYQLHADNPVSPIKISAATVTRPMSFRSQYAYTPEKISVHSTRSRRTPPIGRFSQEAPFQLVASNSLGLSRPVDFSCLEDSPQKYHYRQPAQPVVDTSWMEYSSPGYFGSQENSPFKDRPKRWVSHIGQEARRPELYPPRIRGRRVRSLSEGFS